MKRRRHQFDAAAIGDLTSLAETAEREEVRRAAGAILRYALGETMEEAVRGVPYKASWLRRLLEYIEAHGVPALRSREFRKPRS